MISDGGQWKYYSHNQIYIYHYKSLYTISTYIIFMRLNILTAHTDNCIIHYINITWLIKGLISPSIQQIQMHSPHSTDTLEWRNNDHDGVSNHQPHGCSLNRLFRRKSRKTSKLRVTALCAGIHRDRWIPHTKASNADNVSIWWRHHKL